MLVMASSLVGYADISGYRSMVFNHTNGSVIAITMEDNMSVNLTNGNVELSCAKGTITFSIDGLKYWSYSENEGDNTQWSNIDEITGDAVNISITDSYIFLQNLPENSSVGLVAMDGRVIVADKASGEYQLNISELAQGVYILTYNETSIKFAVK